MDQSFDIPPFDPSLFGSTQFPNPFANGCDDDGSWRAAMPPPSPQIPPYSQIPFSIGGHDGGMPPPSFSLPPILPYSQNTYSCGGGHGGWRASMSHPPTWSSTPQPMGSQNFSPGPSVPLPQLSPSPATFSDAPSAPVEIRDSCWFKNPSLPPMAHEGANSDLLFELNSILNEESEQWIYPKPMEMVGVEERKDKDDDAEESGNKKVIGSKRRAAKDIASSSRRRHLLTTSVDGCLGGKAIISVPPSGDPQCKDPPTNNSDEREPKDRLSKSEMKMIEGNNKLLELAKSDPNKLRRNANARTKQKKALYLSELENKVETLEKENTTLSSRFTTVENDNVSLMGQNRELTLRLQELEKQAQLRNALIDRLTAENQRLRVVTDETSHYRSQTHTSNMQPSNADMFQFHQANINQFHQPQI